MKRSSFVTIGILRVGIVVACFGALSGFGQETNTSAVNVRAWGQNDYGQCNVPPDLTNAVGPTNAWGTIETLTITNHPQLYFDLSAVGQPQRFYRLVQVP